MSCLLSLLLACDDPLVSIPLSCVQEGSGVVETAQSGYLMPAFLLTDQCMAKEGDPISRYTLHVTIRARECGRTRGGRLICLPASPAAVMMMMRRRPADPAVDKTGAGVGPGFL